MVERRGRKKGPSLAYRFQRSMESGDASDKEAPPCDPKSNNPTKKEWSKAISIVVDMETEDVLKRHAAMVVAKKIGLACADLLYYRTNNIHFLLCSSIISIYNSELGVIISSEFFCAKRLRKKHYLLPSIFIYFLLRQFIFYLKLIYLGNLFLYSSIDCDSKITSPTLVQNPCSLCGSH